MPRNGSGSYTLPQSPFEPQTTISSAAVNSNFTDLAAAITASIAADGQTPITAPLKLPSGTAAAPALTFSADQTTGIYYPGARQIGFAAGGVAGFIVNTANAGAGQNGGILTYPSGAIVQPVGVIHDFAGSVAPAGWFLCYGQQVSRTNYPELFTVIGTTYGIGDGSTTFNLPDLRGRTAYGQDNMGGSSAGRITSGGGNFDGTVLGGTGGSQNHTLSVAEMPSHTHTATVTDPGHTHQYQNRDSNFHQDGTAQFDVATQNSTNTTASATTGITVANANQGGGGAHTILSPAIIVNKIIFAGRV